MFKKKQQVPDVKLDAKPDRELETKFVVSAEPADNPPAENQLVVENDVSGMTELASTETSKTSVVSDKAPSVTASTNEEKGEEVPRKTYKYANLWTRLCSAFIDISICVVVGALVVALIEASGFTTACLIHPEYLPDWLRVDSSIPNILVALCFISGSYIIPWLYTALFESSKFEATPGKLIFHLKVHDTQHRQFTFWRSSLRFFLQLLICGIPLLILTAWLHELGAALGVLWQLVAYGVISLSRKKQTLYDMITHRLVEVSPSDASRKHSLKKSALAVTLVALALGAAIIYGPTLIRKVAQRPIGAEYLQLSKEWQECDLSRYRTKIVADRKIKAGSIITAEDLRIVEEPESVGPYATMSEKLNADFQSALSPRILDVNELIGKKALNSTALNDDVNYSALSTTDFKNDQATMLCHAKNHTLGAIIKPTKLPQKYVFKRRVQNTKPIANVTMKDVAISDFVVSDDPPQSLYIWEVLGKELSSRQSDYVQEIGDWELNQSGIGYRATRAFPAGYVLKPEDLKEVHMDAKTTPYSTISDKSLIVGKKLLREIPKDTLVKPYLLEWND